MGNKKVRMTIEFDINEEMLKESRIPASGVLRGLKLRDSDVVDGFDITTHIPGFDNTSDFFLENGEIVETKLIEHENSLDAQITTAAQMNRGDSKGVAELER